MSDLEQALNGEVEQPEVTEQAEAVAEVEVKAETTEATGEVVSPPETDEVAAFKAKALDETRKRQELEQKYQQLESQINSQPQEKPDFWQDPDQAITQLSQEFDSRLQQTVTNMSVEMMRTTHTDYDEMEAQFVDLANQNPALIMQMNQSTNPAKFAYDYAKTQQQVTEMQDPSYREKLKAELLAELEAEKGSEIEAEIRKRSELPGSLANDRAAGGNTATSTARPDLTQLIGN